MASIKMNVPVDVSTETIIVTKYRRHFLIFVTRYCMQASDMAKREILSPYDSDIGKYAKRLGARYVVCTSDLHEENGITYLPIYMSHLL